MHVYSSSQRVWKKQSSTVPFVGNSHSNYFSRPLHIVGSYHSVPFSLTLFHSVMRSGKTARFVKCSAYKRGNLSSIPRRASLKGQVWWCICNPNTEERDRLWSWELLVSQLSWMSRLQIKRDHDSNWGGYLKRKKPEKWRVTEVDVWSPHICNYMCTCTT